MTNSEAPWLESIDTISIVHIAIVMAISVLYLLPRYSENDL